LKIREKAVGKRKGFFGEELTDSRTSSLPKVTNEVIIEKNWCDTNNSVKNGE
jgi:hypothetical protein